MLAASIQRSGRALQYMMLASAKAVGLSCNVISYGAHALAAAQQRRKEAREQQETPPPGYPSTPPSSRLPRPPPPSHSISQGGSTAQGGGMGGGMGGGGMGGGGMGGSWGWSWGSLGRSAAVAQQDPYGSYDAGAIDEETIDE